MTTFLRRFQSAATVRNYWLLGAERPLVGKLCRAGGFQRNVVYGWLKGQRPTEYADQLAAVLRVPRTWLLNGDGDSGDPAIEAALGVPAVAVSPPGPAHDITDPIYIASITLSS